MKTIFAILLMCFTAFAFADGHLEGEEAIHHDRGAETDEEESGWLDWLLGGFNEEESDEGELGKPGAMAEEEGDDGELEDMGAEESEGDEGEEQASPLTPITIPAEVTSIGD